MLLGVRIGERASNARGLIPRFLQLKCDDCGVEFEYPYSKYKAALTYHFCSRKCSQAARGVDGVLRPVMEATMRRKMGDDWALQIGRKANDALTPEEHKARGQKAKQTVLERYGANSAVQIPHVRQSCLEKGRTPNAIAKRKATTRERFGVESVLSIPEIHALANTPEKCHQRHMTMKENGSYFNSKLENSFFVWLTERFQIVERQIIVNSWPIDFYIKDIDTYVQFDGEYWHGLDRSLEEIAKFKTPRDKTILRKYEIDREQDEWFKSVGRRLLRITDKQFVRGEIPDELK